MIRLEAVLDHYGYRYRGVSGNQNIRCPHPDHDDTQASCSAHLDKGLWRCHACGNSGSAIDIIMAHERLTYREALTFAQGLAGACDGSLPGGSADLGGLLPQRAGDRQGSRRYVPPWLR